jgi:antitoxin component of MazEF toxin-antitoxin module
MFILYKQQEDCVATARKIGNSLWVLIPAAMAKECGLRDGTALSITSSGRGIQIRRRATALDAAWVSANVSYKEGPSIAEMREILSLGIVPGEYRVHVNHILTEMPRKLLEAAALEASGSPATALRNLKKIGAQLAAH